ncbi:hypothetical protein PCS_00004 [Desulfocurvibacter africanus PCS]|uniref:Uncharacterized protein n=1 Tax=Desulfocurvibacter africanus PCS TaxID=1262666 RepID=M5Q3V7_DESAF|nr:hypothetical protein PCS_00004 [Desulfocurvibacter africanus PCS]
MAAEATGCPHNRAERFGDRKEPKQEGCQARFTGKAGFAIMGAKRA